MVGLAREKWRAGRKDGIGVPGRDGVVRFRILGPLEFWTGQDWGGIGAPKWRSLLAALLVNRGQAVSADRLIAELWGDDPPASAPNLLSVYVLRLRRVIGDPEGSVLATRAPGYQLRLSADDLDARSFEAARDAGQAGARRRGPAARGRRAGRGAGSVAGQRACGCAAFAAGDRRSGTA